MYLQKKQTNNIFPGHCLQNLNLILELDKMLNIDTYLD